MATYGSSDAEAFLADSPLLAQEGAAVSAVAPAPKRTGLRTAVVVACLVALGLVGVAQRNTVGALLRGSSTPVVASKTTMLTTKSKSSSTPSSSSKGSSSSSSSSKGGNPLMISANPNPSAGGNTLMTSTKDSSAEEEDTTSTTTTTSSSSSSSSSGEVLPGSPNDPAIAEKRAKIEAAKAVIAGTATPEQIELAGVDYEAIVSEAEGAVAPLLAKTASLPTPGASIPAAASSIKASSSSAKESTKESAAAAAPAEVPEVVTCPACLIAPKQQVGTTLRSATPSAYITCHQHAFIRTLALVAPLVNHLPARPCVCRVDQVPTDPEVEAQLVAEENAEVLADDETRPLTKTW